MVLDSNYDLQESYIGAGGPPIETEFGWLLIYHSVREINLRKTYHAMAALFRLDKPELLIARLPIPLFHLPCHGSPRCTNNTVFPTGNALFNDDLYIYYGAADKHMGFLNWISINCFLNY